MAEAYCKSTELSRLSLNEPSAIPQNLNFIVVHSFGDP
jgi:hypothetical protein